MTRIARPAVVCAPLTDDLLFLSRVERANLRRSSMGPARRHWQAVAWLRERAGVFLRRGAIVVVLLVAAAGLTVSTAPAASADIFSFNGSCKRDPHNPTKASDGFGLWVWDSHEAPPDTRWLQYRTAGTYWETYWLDCMDKKIIGNFVANYIFNMSKMISSMEIMLFERTFDGGLLNIFLDADQNVGGTTTTLDDMIAHLQLDFFLQLFSLAVLIGALVVAFRFLFKRESGAKLLGRFAAMILVAGFGFAYGGTPGGSGPNASMIVKTVNDWTNQITMVTLTAFIGSDCERPELLSRKDTPSGAQPVLPMDCVSEQLYDFLIFRPWAVGELGSYESAPRKADNSPGDPTTEELLASRILRQQAYSINEIIHNVDHPKNYENVFMDKFHLACHLHSDLASKAGKLCDREDMRSKVMGVSEWDLIDRTDSWAEIKADNYELWVNWSGGAPDNRLAAASFALVAALSIGLVLSFIALGYLFLQFATVIFALLGPVFFLFGLIRLQVLLRYLELFAGVFIKRIFIGVFVGLLIGLNSILLRAPISWTVKLVIMSTISVFGLVYRKAVAQAFSLNLGGGEVVHKDGEFASSGGARAIAGALGSRRSGGSALGGAFYGAARGAMPGAGQVYDTAMSRNVNARRPGSRTSRRRLPG